MPSTDGTQGDIVGPYDLTQLKDLHQYWAQKWVLHDKEEPGIGRSLFTHSNGQSSNTYFDQYFEPEWEELPEIPENVTWTNAQIVEETCGESYQCKYDY